MGRIVAALAICALMAAGCGSSQQFAAIPQDLDRAHVATDTIDISAYRYVFVPEKIQVQHGRLVVLRVTATDGTHGFALPAFGIDERLEKGVPRVIEFYPPEKGTYDFKCSHLCGIGHFGMNGQIKVE